MAPVEMAPAPEAAPEALWLTPGSGPDLDDLAARIAWWDARGASFLAHAPPGLRAADDARARPAEAHARCEGFLSLEALRGELGWALHAWFGPALAALEVDLATSSLGGARSWLDLRAALPSLPGPSLPGPSLPGPSLPGPEPLPAALLRRCASARGAHDLLFELFCAPRLGASLERYPARLAALAAATRGRARLRVWDAGCGAGESTWALAFALAAGGAEVEALGTTPWPLERLMAERAAFPHDPARTAALAAFLAAGPRARCAVSFAAHDLRAPAPGGCWDVVACHGVLGGALQGPVLAPALAGLAAAVAPGGLLSITDAFRDDLRAPVASALAELAGFETLATGLLRRR
ncbi:MAG: hypothetical protein AB7N76_15225 [Planctomycetota bacterium]